jgi:membrane-associated protease RseP (regulator of RpoE activity)
MTRIIRFLKSYFYVLNNGRPVYISAGEPEFHKPEGYRLNLLLFITTLITTTLAGTHSGDSLTDILISGLPYSLSIMTILTAHEMGHYIAARKFGVRATLPFFIPFPSLIGTMGAVIKTKSPIPDRRALFYIGAMGPLAGFAVSIVLAIIGISMSEIRPLPVADHDMQLYIFGDSALFSILVRLQHGVIPPGHDIFLSPLAWAAWIGFLVTSINLIPIGQLDGGHILFAIIGRKQKYFGWAALAVLTAISFIWYGWIVWVLLALLVLMIAHPHVPDGAPLSLSEKVTGWLCMLILLLTFIPMPVEIF